MEVRVEKGGGISFADIENLNEIWLEKKLTNTKIWEGIYLKLSKNKIMCVIFFSIGEVMVFRRRLKNVPINSYMILIKKFEKYFENKLSGQQILKAVDNLFKKCENELFEISFRKGK